MAGQDRQNASHEVAPWRDKLHEIIFEADTKLGKAFDVTLIVLIVVSVAVVVLSTLPMEAKTEDEREAIKDLYLLVEWVFTGIFAIEYVLRLIVVRRPLRYATSFFGVIDLLSILPAFVGVFVTGGEHLLVVRTLRLLRIFRVFKLARYLSEAQALKRAVLESRHKIAVFLTTVTIVVLIASSVMHTVEGPHSKEETFASIPDAMYWAIITMTTVGYGDITPITPVGKFITAVLVLFGYSLIIVPTGILSAGMASRGRVTTRACPHCMAEGHDLEAVYCNRCGETLESETPAG